MNISFDIFYSNFNLSILFMIDMILKIEHSHEFRFGFRNLYTVDGVTKCRWDNTGIFLSNATRSEPTSEPPQHQLALT